MKGIRNNIMEYSNIVNDNHIINQSKKEKSDSNSIAIMADIHANYYCLEKALEDIKNRGIQTILFLGDYITDGFENNKVLDVIKKYKYVIAGNRELSITNYDGHSWNKLSQFKNMLYTYHTIHKENIDYIKSLPSYKLITLNSKKICLSHGTPFHIREIVNANSFDIFDKLIAVFNCDIYLFAHTHEAFYTTYKNKTFINPGSIILPADGPTSKYGILNLQNMQYKQISIKYDFTTLRNYYLNSDYFKQNQEWCNLLIHTNETGIDYVCGFIRFVEEKAKKEHIDIKHHIPNNLWHIAFLEFMKINGLHIYR